MTHQYPTEKQRAGRYLPCHAEAITALVSVISCIPRRLETAVPVPVPMSSLVAHRPLQRSHTVFICHLGMEILQQSGRRRVMLILETPGSRHRLDKMSLVKDRPHMAVLLQTENVSVSRRPMSLLILVSHPRRARADLCEKVRLLFLSHQLDHLRMSSL